jgi:hypothetical protein
MIGRIGKTALISAAVFGSVATAASAANAEIVCSRAGDCWHVHEHYGYPGGGYAYHPDDWYFHRSWGAGPYRWHDWHQGRGYWRQGVWVPF